MNQNEITVILYANMKEKTGSGRISMSIPENATVGDLKQRLKLDYPTLGPQMANVVVLMNKHHIVSDTDTIPLNAEVTFLPPIAGG